ncbi:hypothetical protein IV102_23425 [bacterium]|nr:hypothetical protein [bacterium]
MRKKQLTEPLWMENGRVSRLRRQEFDDRSIDEGWLQSCFLITLSSLVRINDVESFNTIAVETGAGAATGAPGSILTRISKVSVEVPS